MAKNSNILKLQEALQSLGYDPGPIDGINGPKTKAAAKAFSEAGAGTTTAPVSSFALSADDEVKLASVKSSLANVIRAAAKNTSVPFAVIEGIRTKERQAQLVKQGASKTMNSKHLTGEAVDLWPLDPVTLKKLPSDAAFPRGSAAAKAADKALWDGLRSISTVVKQEATKQGVKITWGGDWKSFPDGPHFELA